MALSGDLLKQLQKQKWFHAIDFGNWVSPSWVNPDLPPNYHLFPVFQLLSEIDLNGLRCLDLGTYDGMTAFVMDALGAERIDAICQYDLERFRLAQEALEASAVHYLPETQIEDLIDVYGEAAFDVVVVSAALHHLTSPQEGLFICRRLLKEGGLFILEAAVLPGSEPAVYLNSELENPVFGNPTVWLPTARGLEGMARLAGFDVVTRLDLAGGRMAREANYERVTFLLRASKPADIKGRTEKLAAIQDEARWTGRIDFRSISNGWPLSAARYSGPAEHRRLDVWSHVANVPLQPKWSDPEPARFSEARLATCDRFMGLMGEYEAHQWSDQDIYPIAMRYAGETFPEGQAWTIKQAGNLFCLDLITKLGLTRVLEIGAGLNLYFDNHLPDWTESWMADSSGFYEDDLFHLVQSRRKRTRFVDALMGEQAPSIPGDHFDAVYSVSVLEHVPIEDIARTALDIGRALKPGGWSIHSLDVDTGSVETRAQAWIDAHRAAGFLEPAAFDLAWDDLRPSGKEVMLEPMSIIQRFHGGYRARPWRDDPKKVSNRWGTVFLALRKPPD